MKNELHQKTTNHAQQKTCHEHHKEHNTMKHHLSDHHDRHAMKHEHHECRQHSEIENNHSDDHTPRGGCHEHHGRRHGRPEGKMRLKRLFERGDLQLLILVQLQNAPSHGYELIKSINELSHGVYEPSPGVIYPTLSMLEDQGLISQESVEKGKKSYLITEEGVLHLKQHEARQATLKERLASAKNSQGNVNFSHEIDHVIRNFKMLLRHQLRHEQLSPEQVTQIVAIINQATQEIEQINQVMADITSLTSNE